MVKIKGGIMDIITGFLVSIILGIAALIPAGVVRLLYKKSFNKPTAFILIMILIITGLLLVYSLAYVMGISIESFSFITLIIACTGTYNLIYFPRGITGVDIGDAEDLKQAKKDMQSKIANSKAANYFVNGLFSKEYFDANNSIDNFNGTDEENG